MKLKRQLIDELERALELISDAGVNCLSLISEDKKAELLDMCKREPNPYRFGDNYNDHDVAELIYVMRSKNRLSFDVIEEAGLYREIRVYVNEDSEDVCLDIHGHILVRFAFEVMRTCAFLLADRKQIKRYLLSSELDI